MRREHETFSDRHEAGRALGRTLASMDFTAPVVLALPRGGVPIGFEVARALNAPLDLVMVRKIGAPGHPEYAIGAVVDGTKHQLVIDDEAASRSGASKSYIQLAVDQAIAEMERRRAAYDIVEPVPLAGRTAIVVDDGIATGNTMRAALKGIARAKPEEVVLAVPVAAEGALNALAPLCDQIICLETPHPFFAVGGFYDDFAQTSDQEVIDLLARARAAIQVEPPGT